ncbi:histidine kinase [Paracoccus suum]|uniref:Histidine kinase n=1 Tax=Paracoccus suum TaxID=2259340 RepID=A0A344PG63_9RHOB|nr:DUF6446 family protein [Paracoccus suum]AXC48368.1 histidine kinase [Paracoccus suum]
MNGKWPALALVAAGLAAGAGVWYMQVWGFYETLPQDRVAPQITATLADGTLRVLPVASAEGIDANSSPVRWRACFTLSQPAPVADMVPFAAPTPLNGPSWFDCYDSGAVTAALASGEAKAYLGAAEVRPDVDRVLAIWPDGHGVAWHQFNEKTPERGVMD